MALSFLKKLDPDAPEAGCVDLKFTGGGEVSKNDIIFFLVNTLKEGVIRICNLSFFDN
jgi:hypothetical protein